MGTSSEREPSMVGFKETELSLFYQPGLGWGAEFRRGKAHKLESSVTWFNPQIACSMVRHQGRSEDQTGHQVANFSDCRICKIFSKATRDPDLSSHVELTCGSGWLDDCVVRTQPVMV